MKKIALLLIVFVLFFSGCTYNKVPNIQAKEYPRYLDTVPIIDNIVFKYPIEKHKINSIITTSGDTINKIEYTLTYEDLKNNFDYVVSDKDSDLKIKTYNSSDIDSDLKININDTIIYAKCDNSIGINNKELIYAICNINKDKLNKEMLKELNKMSYKKQNQFNITMDSIFRVLNNTDIKRKLKYDNIKVKSGSILYKSIGGDLDQLLLTLISLNPDRKKMNIKFFKVWNEVKKDLEYDVIVKGWGLYNNKRVIVTQFQQEIDIKKFLYTILKKSKRVQNKEEFNKIFGNKAMFSKLVGYELYDPKTFIRIYSHNVSYTNLFNKITKRIEILKLKD